MILARERSELAHGSLNDPDDAREVMGDKTLIVFTNFAFHQINLATEVSAAFLKMHNPIQPSMTPNQRGIVRTPH